MKKQTTVITLMGLVVLLSGCQSTNYNDALVAFMASQERVAEINATRDIEVAKQKAIETQAMVTADSGGVSWTDPNSGQTLTYENPNPYFYSRGQATNTVSATTQASPRLSLPPKQPSLTEKTLGFVGSFVSKTVDVALTNAVPLFGIIEQNKTQRTIAEFNYRESSDMFATMGGFGQNMENTSIAATTNMADLGKSALSEMKQLGVSYSDNMVDGVQFFTENFKNDYVQVEKYETIIEKELSEISSSYSVSESSWTLDEDELDNVPAIP